MKKVLKGFTLVELVIVMAILVILMGGIIQMFKPIRSTYVDATLYESQRSTQNGMVKYITESIRFSTDLGLYTGDRVSSGNDAIDKFTKAYLKANGVTTADPAYSTKYSNTLAEMKKYANVIIIDNANNYKYNGYTNLKGGRIWRRKISTLGSTFNESNDMRFALGAAYYGERNYTVVIEDGDTTNTEWKAEDGIKVTVTSRTKSARNGTSLVEKGAASSVSGGMLCRNQCPPINGMFDTDDFTPSASSGSGTKVYIIYTDKKIDIS